MKTTSPNALRKSTLILAGSIAAFLAAQPGQAATQTYAEADAADVWDLTTTNWDGSTVVWTNGNNAIFGGTGESVSVDAAITVGNITFNTPGYSLANGAGSLTLANASNAFTVTNLADTASITTSIAGTSGQALIKAGNGTLDINAVQTYGGSTTISGGTLRLGGSLGAPTLATATYTTADSYSFTPAANDLISGLSPSANTNGAGGFEGSGPVTKLTDGLVGPTTGNNNANRYTIGNGAMLTYDLSGSALGYDLTTVNLYSVWNDNGRDDISLIDISYSTVASPNTFIPITNSGLNFTVGTGNGFAGLTAAGGIFASGVAKVQFNFANQENTHVGYGELEVVGTATGSNLLPVTTAVSIASGSTLDLAGGNQQIASLSGAGSVTKSSAGYSAIFTVGDATSTAFSGTISDLGAPSSLHLVKVGAGTLTLSGANTYSGTTTVNGGVLASGTANALPATTAVTLANTAGAALDLNGNSQTIASLAGGGTTGGNVGLGANAVLTVGDAASTSYGGVISGTGTASLTKTGSGTLTLNANHTYSGPTVVSGGTLKLGTTVAVAATTQTFTSDANSGIGTAGLGTAGYTHALKFGSSGTLTINGVTFTGTGNATSDTGWSTTGYSASHAGGNFPGGYQPTPDQQTYTLLNAFRFGGNPQTLTITGLMPGQAYDARMYYRAFGGGTRAANFTLDPGTGSPTTLSNVDANANATGNYLDFTYIAGATGTLTLTDVPLVPADGWHLYGFSNQAIATATNILPATTALSLAGGSTLDLGGGNQRVASLSGAGAVIKSIAGYASVFTVGDASSTSFSGSLTDLGASGSVELVKIGAGTLTVSGANTQAGGTTVNGGVLLLGAAAGLSTNGSVTVNGGTLNLGGFTTTTTNAVSFQSGVTQNGTIINNGAAYDGRAGTVSAPLQGSAGLTKTTAGNLTLTAANTYSGATTINGGALTVGTNNALPVGTAVTLANTAGAALDVNGNSQTIGSLAGGGVAGGNVTLGANGVLIVGDATSTTYGGVISGTGTAGLTKIGTGTLTLDSTQTYSGPTLVSGGTLKLGGAYTLGATTQTFTSDANSGIGTAGFGTSGYTHALAFNQGANLSINGVTFTDTGTATSDTGWSVSGTGGFGNNGVSGNFPGGFTPASGQTNALLNHFYYGTGVLGSTQTLTITGLAIGKIYDARIYYRSWGNPGSRPVDWTFDAGTGPVTLSNVNEDANTTGNYLDIQYVAGAAGTLTMTATNLANNQSWHLYGFSNQSLVSGGLPASTALQIAGGATLDLGVNSQQVASLSGSGLLTKSTAGSASVFTVGDATSTTFSGTISDLGGSGSLELVKIGTGTLTLSGAQNYSTLTTSEGITNVSGAFTNGTATVNANATTNFTVSQTLGALNIGASSLAQFGSGAGLAVVPEPGSVMLLLVGALGLLGRRRA